MKGSTFLAFASAAAASALQGLEQRQANWTVGQTVQTNSGPVTGHASKNQSEVSEYLGIPFGQAPIGDLRFAAPLKFTGNQPLNGSSYGYSCPVRSGSTSLPTAEELDAANITSAGFTVLSIMSNGQGKYNEDCLNLNVWAKPQVGDAKKAVLVWIYGGGFNSGSSSIAGYNGANIVEDEDVIVVSFNYRLSVLGFPGNPNGTQNLGLLDQRLAVEWVRDNIQSFGGDPDRITLFGQSAGGASIDFYSYAWAQDPIAAGFIPESGNAFGWGLPNTQDFSAVGWFNVTATLECGDAKSDPKDVLACMRKANYTDVLNAVPQLSGTAGILGSFGPTIDNKVIFANYTTATPAKIPMLIGNNNYEAGLFRTELALTGTIFPDIFWDDFNLQEFTCPTGIRANVSWTAGTPIWRYRYFGVFPNLAISEEAGSWHAAEIPIIFNTAPLVPGPTTEEISIANYMRGAWAAFAKDPANGLTSYGGGWPKYDPSQNTLVRLAYENKTGTNLESPYVYDYLCPYVDVHSTDPSAYLDFPSVNPTVSPAPRPTASSTSSGGGSSSTASPTASGTVTGASSTPTGAGSRVEMSVWVVLAAGIVAWVV